MTGPEQKVDVADLADSDQKATDGSGSSPETDTAAGADAASAVDGVVSEAAQAPADDADAESAAPSPEAQLAERTEDLQRLSAEFANYRRRVERDRLVTTAAAKASVLEQILPIADDLERARAHGDLEEGPLKVFADKILALLSAQGVQEFGAEGEAFDPALHEAVQDESTGGEPVIGTVLRKGYRLGERTLRTAMVIVQ